jgi:SHS2 domain-containing protein
MAYRWAEHVGELELCVEAATEEDVLADALRAFGELLGEPADHGDHTAAIEAEGADRAALLAAWLEELIFLAETEGFIPAAVEELALEPQRASARVRGRRGAPPHLVKAVTYHRLAFERADGGWRAVAVLDV